MKFNRFSTLRGLTAGSHKAANLLKICGISALLFSVSAFADDDFFNSPAGASNSNQEAMVTDFYGKPVPAHSADYYNHLIANAGNEKINDLDKKVDAAKSDPKLNALQQKVLSEGANSDEDQSSAQALKHAMSKPQQVLVQPQHKVLPPPPQPEVIYHTPVAKQQGNATNFSSATSGQQQDSGGLGIQY